ncbi:MAG: hypothetical protein ABW215_15305 [Kibdelosporangium sp.]
MRRRASWAVLGTSSVLAAVIAAMTFGQPGEPVGIVVPQAGDSGGTTPRTSTVDMIPPLAATIEATVTPVGQVRQMREVRSVAAPAPAKQPVRPKPVAQTRVKKAPPVVPRQRAAPDHAGYRDHWDGWFSTQPKPRHQKPSYRDRDDHRNDHRAEHRAKHRADRGEHYQGRHRR